MGNHIPVLFFGWGAVLLSLGATFSQLWRVGHRGTEGVSLATWTLFMFMGCFWIAYGVERRSLPIVMGSLLVLPLQVALILQLKPWRAVSTVVRALMFSVVFCAVPTLLWGWPGGVYGTGIAMVANRAPQIIELVRYRDASGVSVTTWVLGVVGSIVWVVYFRDVRLWAALVSTTLAGLASLTIALLAAWRHRQVPVRQETNDVVAHSWRA